MQTKTTLKTNGLIIKKHHEWLCTATNWSNTNKGFSLVNQLKYYIYGCPIYCLHHLVFVCIWILLKNLFYCWGGHFYPLLSLSSWTGFFTLKSWIKEDWKFVMYMNFTKQSSYCWALIFIPYCFVLKTCLLYYNEKEDWKLLVK